MHACMYKYICTVSVRCQRRPRSGGSGAGALPGAAALSRARSPARHFADGRGVPNTLPVTSQMDPLANSPGSH